MIGQLSGCACQAVRVYSSGSLLMQLEDKQMQAATLPNAVSQLLGSEQTIAKVISWAASI